MKSLVICTPYRILCGWQNREEWDGRGMWRVWGGVHRVLVGKPAGKRPLGRIILRWIFRKWKGVVRTGWSWLRGRLRRRWEDNIKMDLQELGGGCEDWMELAQDRDRWRALVSTVMNLRVPKMRGISWLAAEPVRFSRTLLHGVSK